MGILKECELIPGKETKILVEFQSTYKMDQKKCIDVRGKFGSINFGVNVIFLTIRLASLGSVKPTRQ